MAYAPNLIDLLSIEEPNLLQKLKTRYPLQAELFTSKRLLGEKEEKLLPPPDTDKRTAIIDLIVSSSAALVADLDKLSSHIRKTMKTISWIRFSGSIITIFSGGFTAVI